MYCIDFVMVPMKEHVLLLIITIDNNLLFNVQCTYLYHNNILYKKQKILTFLTVIENYIGE